MSTGGGVGVDVHAGTRIVAKNIAQVGRNVCDLILSPSGDFLHFTLDFTIAVNGRLTGIARSNSSHKMLCLLVQLISLKEIRSRLT